MRTNLLGAIIALSAIALYSPSVYAQNPAPPAPTTPPNYVYTGPTSMPLPQESVSNVVPSNAVLTFGNPDGAIISTLLTSHSLVTREGFAASSNSDTGISNWVAYMIPQQTTFLSALGPKDFSGYPVNTVMPSDVSLPPGWSLATSEDYEGAGYTVGYFCDTDDPASWTTINAAAFSTNMYKGAWTSFNGFLRAQSAAGNQVYVVAGPVLTPPVKTIGIHKVSVPTSVFKIALIITPGRIGPNTVESGKSEVVAIVCPNDGSVGPNADWTAYISTASAISNMTGLQFFTGLSPIVQPVFAAEKYDPKNPILPVPAPAAPIQTNAAPANAAPTP